MEYKINESMGWVDHYRMMKRWYYRLRGNGVFGLNSIHQEDFYIAFFLICEHFPEWLIKDGVATLQEATEWRDKNDILQLCREIANFSKHTKLKEAQVTDKDTKIVSRMFLVQPPTGASYHISRLQVTSPERKIDTLDALDIVEKCLNVWSLFLISKSQEIPELIEEHIYQNFTAWKPHSP